MTIQTSPIPVGELRRLAVGKLGKGDGNKRSVAKPPVAPSNKKPSGEAIPSMRPKGSGEPEAARKGAQTPIDPTKPWGSQIAANAFKRAGEQARTRMNKS